MGFRFSVLALMVALFSSAVSADPRIQIRLDLGGNRGNYQGQCPPGYYYCNQHGQYCNHGQNSYYQTNYNQGYYHPGYYNQGYYNQGYSNQGYSNQGACNTGYSNRGYRGHNYGQSRGRGHNKHNRGHGCRR